MGHETPQTTGSWQRGVAAAVIAMVSLSLWSMQSMAVSGRYQPSRESKVARIEVVATQREAYRVSKSHLVRGAVIVQLGRFSNLQYWVPEYLAKSAPFPLQVYDVRPEYENGLQSHNWLFIATRTGIARKVVSVLPIEEFRSMESQLDSDYALRRTQGGYAGYHHDIPRVVTTLGNLLPIAEPVVLTVDTSFFGSTSDPVATAQMLAQRLPSVPLLVLVSSLDENDITWEMRRKMALFIRAWQERG